MKKLLTLVVAAAIAIVGSFVAPKSAEAVPAFARQVGVDCYACHFQHIPKLNAFGRSFKTGGMTQAGGDLLEGEGLSIAQNLGIGMVMKYRYQKTSTDPDSKKGKDRGAWDMPDEIAFFVGGRMGEHWGYVTEGASTDTNNKIIYTTNVGGLTAGGYIQSTEGGGAAYGMDIANNQRFNRGWENRSAVYPSHKLGGSSSGAAVGLGGYATNDMFFATFSLFGPAAPDSGIDAAFAFANYIAAYATPKVGDMDIVAGVQMTSGEAKVGEDGVDVYPVGTTTIWVNAQKPSAGGMSIDAHFEMASTKAETVYNANSDGSYTGREAGSALGLGVAVAGGALGHNTVKANFLSVANDEKGGKYSAISLGVNHAFAQNVELVLEFTSYSGDDKPNNSHMLLMLETAI